MKLSRRIWLRLAAALGAVLLAGPRMAAARGNAVMFGGNYRPGTIVIVTRDRALFYVLGGGQAIRYPVGAWPGAAARRSPRNS
jgi:lipoprotein-anchoring transpeptidase ErfK/SrfK